MLVIVRKDAKLSQKTSFLVRLLGKTRYKIFYVFKTESEQFREKWCCDSVQLPSSTRGIIIYYLLVMLKSPREFRNAFTKRYLHTKPKRVLAGQGFLSALRYTLYLHFGTSARADRLMYFLHKIDKSKIFLIDEFVSLNCLDLRKLKALGPIIYVSQDIAYNQYDLGDNLITRQLMFRLEHDVIDDIDLIVACSETERLKYLEMGAKNVIFYPNIYPTKEFEPCDKDATPSICIVLRDHWGFRASQSLRKILDGLGYLDRQIRVHLIGVKPSKVPQNIVLEHHEFLQSKLEYLKLLSRSWVGINVGVHKGGANQRKYDYAEAGTVVFSDTLGARGDLLPHEYTYVDSHDLAAKIGQLLRLGKSDLMKMGKENRNQALFIADRERKILLDNIDTMENIGQNLFKSEKQASKV
jgi:hypothetical protein